MKMNTFITACVLFVMGTVLYAQDKPNVLVIWGDDIGYWNISHNNHV